MSEPLKINIDVKQRADGSLEATADFAEYVEGIREDCINSINAAILNSLEPQLNQCGWVKERTCRIVKTWSDSDYANDWRYRCSECFCFIPVYERDIVTGDVISAANYCPNCGRKVLDDEHRS